MFPHKTIHNQLLLITFLFPPNMASNFDPFGGGEVADAGGVTLDALGGVAFPPGSPPVGDKSVGDVMLMGVTFKDEVSPAFFSCMSIALK